VVGMKVVKPGSGESVKRVRCWPAPAVGLPPQSLVFDLDSSADTGL